MSTRAHALFFDLIPLFLVDVVRYEIHKRDSRIEDLCFVTNSIKLVGRDMAGRPVVAFVSCRSLITAQNSPRENSG